MLASVLAPVLAACGGAGVPTVQRAAFSSKEFGVSVSPRVTNMRNPPRGGGRHMVGKPYTVRGDVYTPLEDASGYGVRAPLRDPGMTGASFTQSPPKAARAASPGP